VSSVSEVSPGVWRTVAAAAGKHGRGQFTVNAYLVVDGDEAMFVDTAWVYGSTAKHLDDVLAAAGVAPSAVSHIFITHAHRDHFGWMNHLAELTGARLWLHRDEEGTVRSALGYQGLSRPEAEAWYRSQGVPGDVASAIIVARVSGLPVDVSRVTWGASHDLLRVGKRVFEAIPCAGHTNGHTCLFEPDSGLLFSGDALLPRGHGNPHVTCRPLTMPDPLTAYVGGLEKLRGLGVQRCLPGHGPSVDDAVALISGHLSYVAAKLRAVESCLGEDGMTAFDVVRRIPWRGGRRSFDDLVSDERFLAFGDVLARLRRLAALGRSTSTYDPIRSVFIERLVDPRGAGSP
jgi:glyoxylase-like metal-dependent hydrolase (beta-lactamase superfamily II)